MNPLTVFPKAAVAEHPVAAQVFPGRAKAAENAPPRELPATPAPATGTSAPAYPSLLAWAASQSGDQKTRATINDPIFGKELVARLDGDYFSAAGLSCRRVKVSPVADGVAAETIAVCRQDQGDWFMAPRGGTGTVPGGNR